MEPKNVVEWNVILFSVMGGVSGLQTLLCAANIMNTLLGLVVGRGFCHNKVTQSEQKIYLQNKSRTYKSRAVYTFKWCRAENVQLMYNDGYIFYFDGGNMILCVSCRSLQFLFEMCPSSWIQAATFILAGFLFLLFFAYFIKKKKNLPKSLLMHFKKKKKLLKFYHSLVNFCIYYLSLFNYLFNLICDVSLTLCIPSDYKCVCNLVVLKTENKQAHLTPLCTFYVLFIYGDFFLQQ